MILRFFSFLLLATLFLTSCREDDEVTVTNSPANVNINGFVQKGPFLNGTSLIASELNDAFAATGKVFTTQISDNQGTFVIKASGLEHPYLQVNASGFYFDEVRGEKSSAQLTLFALTDISGTDATVNVNVLSHLEKDRTLFLVEQGESFAEAKQQAQREIVAIFGIERDDMLSSEQLNIFQDGDDHAILLAISAILQGNNTVAELSELLANITNDLQEDGTLDDEKLTATLRQNAMNLNLPDIRQHLLKRYQELKIEAAIPNFEQYIDSDGDGILNKEEDDTPDDFAFEPQVDVAINTQVVSNEIVVSGLKENGASDISVSNGQIIINGQAINDSTALVKNGDKVKLQVVSSGNYADEVIATVQIGSYLQRFSVTTDDYLADSFSFFGQEDVAVETYYTSDTIIVSGLPYPTPITTENAILIKNGEEITSETISIVNGDQIALRLLSSDTYSTSTKATLTINEISADFEIITDDYAPDEFSFKDIVNARLGVSYLSDTITITGLPHEVPEKHVSFSVDYNGGYRYSEEIKRNEATIYVNGTAYVSYEGSPVSMSVSDNDQVYVELVSSSSYSSTLTATLLINGESDAYEVTTVANPLQALANFPGKATSNRVSFSINEYIYVGLGNEDYSTGQFKEFYRFNTNTNVWDRIEDFPGTSVSGAVTFTLSSKGYIALGMDKSESPLKDIWAYNPQDDLWYKSSDFPGEARSGASVLSIGNDIFIGLGVSGTQYLNDFWKFSLTTDTWTQVGDFAGEARAGAFSFCIGEKGYIGGGWMGPADTDSFWEYDPNEDNWTEKAKLRFPTMYLGAFSIDHSGFTMLNGEYIDKYDADQNRWSTILIDFLQGGLSSRTMRAVSKKGYLLGQNNKFYQFTPPQD